MTLTFDPKPSNRWPAGYWYARTDDHPYLDRAEGVGDTPLNAVTALALALEAER